MKRGPKFSNIAALKRRGAKVNDPTRHRKDADLIAAAPPPPKWMTDRARAFYYRISNLLDASNAIALTDRDSLAMLSTHLARQAGLLQDPNYDPKEVLDLDRMIRPLLKEFGLTPCSRHGLKRLADPAEKSGELAKFLRLG